MKSQGDKMTKITPYYLISAALKGISQVILIENVVSGLIILIAITIANYQLGIVALLSAIIGTLVAHAAGGDKNVIEQGLFGYNSVLTGLALYLFLTGSMRMVIALLAAAFVTIFTAAMMHFLKKLEHSSTHFSLYCLNMVFPSYFLSSRSFQDVFRISSTGFIPLAIED